MTILPITFAVPQPPLGNSPALDVASPADGTDAIPNLPADTMPAPGAHAAPVSGSDPASPMPATIAASDTPGDDILAGLNKRWTRFSRALGEPVGNLARVATDAPASTQPSPDTLPNRDSGSTWSPVDDHDYDAHIDRMAEIARLQQHVRDVDDGGALTLQLSKSVSGLTSSIKTLVTGQ